MSRCTMADDITPIINILCLRSMIYVMYYMIYVMYYMNYEL